METYLALFLAFAALSQCHVIPSETTTKNQEETTTPESPPQVNATLDIRKMIRKKCVREYSFPCFKLDLALLVPALRTARSYSIFPGLEVVIGGAPVPPPPGLLTPETAEEKLDMYLAKGFDTLLDTLSLQIKVLDNNLDTTVKNFSEVALGSPENKSGPVSGRRKKYNHALLMGGMVSAGTMLAMAMSAISAMAGKALLISILSLGMSFMSSTRQQSQGQGKTTYEIITHSVPSHDEYSNRKWFPTQNDEYQYLKP